jgi:hypothetical protein
MEAIERLTVLTIIALVIFGLCMLFEPHALTFGEALGQFIAPAQSGSVE